MISVVVPTYNDSHFLPAALASCLAQTVPVEIVLVDDGSTSPLSDEVCRFISEHRDIVTYVRHAWNCGLSAARNSGIAQARYDLVIPLDADDWFIPGALAPLASKLTEDVDIVYGNVLDSGQLYEPVKTPLRRADFLNDTPLFCSSLFRKTVWQAVSGYTVRPGPHYEDWNFWAKAFKAGFRFHYAPITVYEHRSRPDSMLRFLHPERARYVRVATEPLLDPEPPVAALVEPDGPRQGEAGVAAPATSSVTAEATPGPEMHGGGDGAATVLLADLVDPSIRSGHLDAVLRVLAGEPYGVLAAEYGLDEDGLRDSVRRFVEQGARALQPVERRTPPDLVLAHARIGRLMIELERIKALLPGTADLDAHERRMSADLVSAHATIGRLLLQRRPAATRSSAEAGLHPAPDSSTRADGGS